MARVAGKVAALLAGTCSSQTIRDQSLLIQRALEVDQSTAACPSGYTPVPGDVGGWDHFGRGMDNVQDSAQQCADDCDAHSGCESFEWSPTTNICSLNKVPAPNMGPFSDYLFCQRDQGGAAGGGGPTQETGPTGNASAAYPGYAGFVLSRIPTQSSAPGWVDITLGSCDANGTCVCLWDTAASLVVKSTQSVPAMPSDVISYSYNVDLSARNASASWDGIGWGLGDKFVLGESCAVCTGSCVYESTTQEYRFTHVRPTDWDSNDTCKASVLSDIAANVTGMTMLNATVPLPDWTEAQLEGHVYVTSSLKDSAGQVKSTDAFALTMNGTSTVNGTSAPAMRRKRRAPGQAVTQSLPGALLSTVKRAVSSTIAGLFEAAKAASETMSMAKMLGARSTRAKRDETAGDEYALVFNATVLDVAGQVSSNFTLSAPQACVQVDSNGSVACQVPLKTQPFNMSAFLNLEASLDMGDYVNMTVRPRMGGLFGPLAERILQSQTVTLPLCGEGAITETYGALIIVPEQKCGAYRLSYERLTPKVVTAADLPIQFLPPVPELGLDLKMEDFLPSGIEVGLKVMKKSGATILSASSYLGLVKI